MADMLDAVLEKTSSFFTEKLKKGVMITRIDEKSLIAWKETWDVINKRQPPNGGWDWEYKNSSFNKNYGKYLIGIAVWSDDSLCGLALCTRSKGNEVLSIHYIEGSPNESHHLRGNVFTIINSVLLEYATLIKAKTIRIIDPVDNLVDFYKSFGYKLSKKLLSRRKFCERGI